MKNKQTILVTGATGSIGGAAALALAKAGARVVLLGRNQEKLNKRLQRVQIELSNSGIGHQKAVLETLVVDFADMDSVRNAAAQAMEQFPEIHGLILSVGALLQNGPNILPNGHEQMFATNIMGPFLFTQLLLERIEASAGLVLHVIAPFTKALDWDDLESVKKHKTMLAFDRTKTCNRVIAGELARRYEGRISSVAFDPTYVIDKTDPELKKRWPTGFTGFLWRLMTLLFAKAPAVAGEPMANLMLTYQAGPPVNGAMFKLYERVEKPVQAMNDEALGRRLWEELETLTSK